MQATEANLAKRLVAHLSEIKGEQVKQGVIFYNQLTDSEERLFWKVLSHPDMEEKLDGWQLEWCATFNYRHGSVSVWRYPSDF
jgi:hypothetical protein